MKGHDLEGETDWGFFLFQNRVQAPSSLSTERLVCGVEADRGLCLQSVVHSRGAPHPLGWKGGRGVSGLGPPWSRALDMDLSSDQTPLAGEPTGPSAEFLADGRTQATPVKETAPADITQHPNPASN